MKKRELIHYLNQLLSNHFVMYVKLHRYHWYVQGKHFFQLHEKFAEMYSLFGSECDAIAERILMIDGKPFATMTKYVKKSTLEEANADDTEEEMISQLLKDYTQLISEIDESGIRYAEEQRDEPTLDLLIRIKGQLEKYVWMLSAYQVEK